MCTFEVNNRPAAVVIQLSSHDVAPWAWLIKVKELEGSLHLSIKSSWCESQNSISSEPNIECDCMSALKSHNTKP